MRILLVNPYIYDFTAFDLWLRPLGLLYIASVLRRYTDAELYWLDALDRFQENAFPPGESVTQYTQANGQGKYHRETVERPQIYADIPRTYARYGIPLPAFLDKRDAIPEVDLILMTSLMTYWIDGVRLTLETLKSRFPRAKVVVGGILPTLIPHDLLRCYVNADYWVHGYGEEEILTIIQAENGRVYPHPDLTRIDHIPEPAVDFLSNRDILPLMTSRGCPFQCTYCASNRLNPHFIEREPQAVYEDIYRHHEMYGTRHFIIFDDALLINKRRRFLTVFQKVKDHLNVHFHTPNGLHAGEIDRETAETMFASGFKTLRLSFESTREEILARSSNKVSVRQMIQAVENLEAAGYQRRELDVYLLFGFPGQRVDDIREALDFVGDLGVNPHLSFYSPVPGTQDFIRMQESGVLSTPVNLYETNKIYFLYHKSGLNREAIAHLKNMANRMVVPPDHRK
ncbi:MAG: B12-binding domain-containing radical SAM protein [Candidatus Omnitrophota bacterium]